MLSDNQGEYTYPYTFLLFQVMFFIADMKMGQEATDGSTSRRAGHAEEDKPNIFYSNQSFAFGTTRGSFISLSLHACH